MITAQEIEYGNWLHYHGIPVIAFRDKKENSIGLAISDSYKVDPGKETLYLNLDPVPLDPLTLEACGFVLEENWHESKPEIYRLDDIEALHVSPGNTIIKYKGQEIKEIESLHQLQNWYKKTFEKKLQVEL